MSIVNDDGRTARWKTGDPITHTEAGVTGFAKWTYPRKSDGKRFLRVQITSGKRAGYEDWESGLWTIGQGKHQSTCRDCGYRFRTNHLEDLWCPCCQREHAPTHDGTAMSAAHHRALLRGNATRDPVMDAVNKAAADRMYDELDKDDSDFKSPF